MPPKLKSSDAGHSDMTKRSHKLLLLSERKGVCVGKNIVHVGFGTIYGFRHPLEVLECIS